VVIGVVALLDAGPEDPHSAVEAAELLGEAPATSSSLRRRDALTVESQTTLAMPARRRESSADPPGARGSRCRPRPGRSAPHGAARGHPRPAPGPPARRAPPAQRRASIAGCTSGSSRITRVVSGESAEGSGCWRVVLVDDQVLDHHALVRRRDPNRVRAHPVTRWAARTGRASDRRARPPARPPARRPGLPQPAVTRGARRSDRGPGSTRSGATQDRQGCRRERGASIDESGAPAWSMTCGPAPRPPSLFRTKPGHPGRPHQAAARGAVRPHEGGRRDLQSTLDSSSPHRRHSRQLCAQTPSQEGPADPGVPLPCGVVCDSTPRGGRRRRDPRDIGR
jgi:hypothetical protein